MNFAIFEIPQLALDTDWTKHMITEKMLLPKNKNKNSETLSAYILKVAKSLNKYNFINLSQHTNKLKSEF